MSDSKLTADYWNNRYKEQQTGWDIGYISTPLKTYIDQLTDKSLRILIPGGGNSYEAEYLFTQGFTNVYVVDVSAIAKENFLKRIPSFPEAQFLVTNFFELTEKFDLILEQTFFCALDPSLRPAYAKKMNELLVDNGRLVGLLFDFPLAGGPPFGGDQKEYQQYFEPLFTIKIMEPCYNSIPPRQGKELFINLLKNS